jgi:uncharacterized protein YyaL (SSP411 family)
MKDQGGWPLSMFLTADGKPILGFTYRPREDQEEDGKKYKGFKSIARDVDEAWKNQRRAVLEKAEENAEKTTNALIGFSRLSPLFEMNRELVSEAVESLLESFDRTHGGFGAGERTKFPLPSRLLLLQEEAVRNKSAPVIRALDVTLDRMARGGIYDQVGGGFHRYSTERTWTVPHFEKMLYDNAQLVEVYSLAWQRKKDPLYRRIIQETLGFIEREMTSLEGGFYSALDADSEEEEGRFYVWTPTELAKLISDRADLSLFRSVYGATEGVNFEGKYHILRLPKTLAEQAAERKMTEEQLLQKLEPIRKQLLGERGKRPRPFLDTKVLTAWNGQMIAGYAVAGQMLEEKKYIDAAVRAADFLLRTMRTKDGRLLRTYGAAPGQKPQAKLNGYLDDYAYLVHGLLCLHDATTEKKWLDEAKALTDVMVKFHLEEKVGGFFYTSSDHEKLFARSKDQFDGAQPSGNSMAARNLVRLWVKTGDEKYQKLALKTIRSLAIPYKANPLGLSALGSAIGMYLDVKKK